MHIVNIINAILKTCQFPTEIYSGTTNYSNKGLINNKIMIAGAIKWK